MKNLPKYIRTKNNSNKSFYDINQRTSAISFPFSIVKKRNMHASMYSQSDRIKHHKSNFARQHLWSQNRASRKKESKSPQGFVPSMVPTDGRPSMQYPWPLDPVHTRAGDHCPVSSGLQTTSPLKGRVVHWTGLVSPADEQDADRCAWPVNPNQMVRFLQWPSQSIEKRAFLAGIQ